MSDWQRERKIVRLPGARLTAETVLASTLEKARAGHVKSVVVVIQWDDDTYDCDWSQQKISELCMASVVASDLARMQARPGANE